MEQIEMTPTITGKWEADFIIEARAKSIVRLAACVWLSFVALALFGILALEKPRLTQQQAVVQPQR